VADAGTNFLDEIGDMKPGLQAKLLCFIENRVFRRVGGHRDISVDVRIVAATDRNLGEIVRTGAFREDLFFRLNVIPIRIPPLRDRREDFVPLAEHLLEEFSNDICRPRGGFSDFAKRQLASYDWSGNVREPRNIVERALIPGVGDLVPRFDLPLPAEAGSGVSPAAGSGAAPFPWEPAGERAAGPPEAVAPVDPFDAGERRVPPAESGPVRLSPLPRPARCSAFPRAGSSSKTWSGTCCAGRWRRPRGTRRRPPGCWALPPMPCGTGGRSSDSRELRVLRDLAGLALPATDRMSRQGALRNRGRGTLGEPVGDFPRTAKDLSRGVTCNLL